MSRHGTFKKLAHCIVLFQIIGGGAALAQGHRAIILGQVQDSSGATIPGADVKVIQKTTNIIRTTITNDAGNFEVPALLPGTYRVEVALVGFKTAVVDDVPVASAQRVELQIILQIGEIAESVTVRSNQQLLDTANADVSVVIDQKKLGTLPIGQGNPTYLFLYSPSADSASGYGGWGPNQEPYQRAGSGLVRFNGLPTGTAEFTLDGTPNTQRGNAVSGGAVSFNPPTETVQEMRIQTSTFDASVGHTGSTTIDVIMKTGTNEYHGEAFYFFRNADWDANWWLNNRNNLPKPDNPYKRWGFTGGGPILKNRTFFFYGYTHWAQIRPGGISGTVPRSKHLEGDFSDLLAVGPQYQLYDPFSARLTPAGRVQRDPFPGNIIPANRIHQFAKVINKWWPVPNQTGTADGNQNYAYDLTPLPRHDDHHVLRIDHKLTRAHSLFGRVLLSDNPANDWTLWNHHPGGPLTGEVDVNKTRQQVWNYALSDVWTMSPTFILDFRGSVARHNISSVPNLGGLSWADLPGGVANFVDPGPLGFPHVQITGYPRLGDSPASRAGFFNFNPSEDISEIRSATTHLTKIHGNHSLKFGADFRGYIRNTRRFSSAGMVFGGGYTKGPFDNSPVPPQGSGLADLLLGLYSSATISRRAQFANLTTFQALYFQDDWKVTPRLTINAGVRYEREGPPTERFDQALIGFARDVDNPIAAQARANYANNPLPELPASQFQVKGGLLFAGVNGPRGVYEADNNNFSPRFGMAYQLNNETVLRGGYSISYIPNVQRFFAAEFPVPGFDQNTFSFASTDGGLTFSSNLDNLFPSGVQEPVGAKDGLKTFLGQGVFIPTGLDRVLTNAYAHQFQFSIQRSFGGNNRLEVRYVGNRSEDFPLTRNERALPNRYLSTSKERDQANIDFLTARIPNPYRGIPGVGGALGTATVIGRSDLLSPFNHFASLTSFAEQLGSTSYNALQVEFQSRMDNGLSLQTSYTWGKTMEALSFLNAGDPEPYRTIGGNDRPHVWRFVGNWELPLGQSLSGPARALARGWTISALSFYQSGIPMPWGNIIFRGNIKDIPVKTQTSERMFNTEAGFERDPLKQLSLNLRTFPLRLSGVRDQATADVSLTVVKDTFIGERFRAQFRAEAYNVFNWHFYTGLANNRVNTSPTSTLFGTQTTVSSLPRVIQLGVKFIF